MGGTIGNIKGNWPDDVLTQLAEGNLNPDILLEMQRATKEDDRFERINELEQKRVPWKDKIVLCLQENLYIVEKEDKKIVKCICGHEFGDYHTNWKEFALVYERDTEEKLEEVYQGRRKPDPNWQVIREFYCPTCAVQLDVEAVLPLYPFVFTFLPDFEAWERRKSMKD
jgi:acetone carboxylase gamma subunit